MTKSQMDLRIIEEAKKEGLDVNNLSPAQFRRLSFKVRSSPELVRDGAAAITSRTLTSIHLRVVSEEKSIANRSVCESNICGRFRLLNTKKQKGKPACLGCHCSGKWLESKWRDKKQMCPLVNPATNEPYWDNTK